MASKDLSGSVQRASKDFKNASKASSSFCMALEGLERASNVFKRLQRSAEGMTGLQIALKKLRRASNALNRASKGLQRASKGFKRALKEFRKGFKSASIGLIQLCSKGFEGF
jgi:hypothetical protein